ncbi:hypothetical protein EAS56_17640 [Bradyrhizobium guangzhouense]|uniref:IS66 family transposase n=1 Tax=Bradyrhizobium guangzhouense TaxID=1325095 RepID=A0ABY0E7U6_9BRAD|nr:hypothetical protein [Bradyrhizobium guangzhouense]RXH12331.1 hypothetical protein EAS56_17640 [Bradyrhizobium guangzhouense]
MIDEKIARVKKLIEQREAIDAELASIFNMATTKRGRPRKESGSVEEGREERSEATQKLQTDILPQSRPS